MTPEQKQQRIEQIRERQSGLHADAQQLGDDWCTGTSVLNDIDFLLSLVKSQEAGSDLKNRDDVLVFFGATMKENGDLSINMKKYHAAHLCQEHSFEPWRRTEIEEKCVMCLARDRENAATSMRSACVTVAKDFQRMDRDDFYRKYKTSMLITALESVSIQGQK